jgi:hypothetical protein
METAEGAGEHSRALLDLAKAQEKQAAVAWREAEKNEQDSFITARSTAWSASACANSAKWPAPGAPVFKIVDNSALDARHTSPRGIFMTASSRTAKIAFR